MAIPGLKESQYTQVFRAICQRLQTDPVLKGAGVKWQVWGGPFDASGQTLGLTPNVRLTPQLGGSDWYAPESHIVPLIISVEMLVDGTNADDPLNLWAAIEEAFYPPGDRDDINAWILSLTQSPYYAVTGQITFIAPASIQQADENQFRCAGQMKLDLRRIINP